MLSARIHSAAISISSIHFSHRVKAFLQTGTGKAAQALGQSRAAKPVGARHANPAGARRGGVCGGCDGHWAVERRQHADAEPRCPGTGARAPGHHRTGFLRIFRGRQAPAKPCRTGKGCVGAGPANHSINHRRFRS